MYYKIQTVLDEIKKAPDVDPYKHDGCYILVQKAVDMYAELFKKQSNLKKVNKNDFKVFYNLTAHIKTSRIDTKIAAVENSNLESAAKTDLIKRINDIWVKTQKELYSNREQGGVTVGMFGGVAIQIDNIKEYDSRKFILMLVRIRLMNNKKRIYEEVDKFLKSGFSFIGVANISQILHCLKPDIFPIINGATEYFFKKAISGYISGLGSKDAVNYINNCEKIYDFKSKNHIKFTNYRTMDMCITKYCDLVDFESITEFLKIYGGTGYDSKAPGAQVISEKGTYATSEVKILGGLVKSALKNKSYIFGTCNSWQNSGNIYNYFFFPVKDGSSVAESRLAVAIEKIKGKVYVYVKAELDLKDTVKVTQADIDKFNGLIKNIKAEDISGDVKFITIPDGNKFLSLSEAQSLAAKITGKRRIIICPAIKIGRPYSMDYTQSIVGDIVSAINALTPYYAAFNSVTGGGSCGQITIKYNGGEKKVNDKNIILYGPPGTGKTYSTVIRAVKIINGETYVENHSYSDIKNEYEKYLNKRIKFITFHQSYSYEDFIEGIKPKVIPVVPANNATAGSAATSSSAAGSTATGNPAPNPNKKYKTGKVVYGVENGVFKEFCMNADGDCVQPKGGVPATSVASETDMPHNIEGGGEDGEDKPPYVFIIDEINRGNISKIFGELITLIEETKRKGKKEMASATLPYSGDKFSVPSNVYIIGTMNTADRSLAVVDTALRRRFTFEEMMPDPSLADINVTDGSGKSVNVREALEILNMRITALCDREHTIGHSFFMDIANGADITELGRVFCKNIIPLLQEYFYEDYGKIMAVLGDNQKEKGVPKFIELDELSSSALFGAGDYLDGEKAKFYTVNADKYEPFNDALFYKYLQYDNCPALKTAKNNGNNGGNGNNSDNGDNADNVNNGDNVDNGGSGE